MSSRRSTRAHHQSATVYDNDDGNDANADVLHKLQTAHTVTARPAAVLRVVNPVLPKRRAELAGGATSTITTAVVRRLTRPAIMSRSPQQGGGVVIGHGSRSNPVSVKLENGVLADAVMTPKQSDGTTAYVTLQTPSCDMKPATTTGSLAWQHMLKHLQYTPSSPQARRKLVLDGGAASLNPTAARSEPRSRKRKLIADDQATVNHFPSTSVNSLSYMQSAAHSGDTAAVLGTRFDSSLKLLTERFVHMGHEAVDGVVQLNEAAATLQVPKRRLYDITNVLEGIDLVEKVGKNSIRWKSATAANEFNRRESQLMADMAADDVLEAQMDDMLLSLESTIARVKTDPLDGQYAYVHYADVRQTAAQLVDAQSIAADRMLIVVRSPHASHVNGTHEMVIRSRDERPVEVYLCPQEEEHSVEDAHVVMPLPNMQHEAADDIGRLFDTPVRMINDDEPHRSPFKRCALAEHMCGDVMLAAHASPHKGSTHLAYEHYSNRGAHELTPFTPSKLLTLPDPTAVTGADVSDETTTAQLTSAGIMSC